MSEIMRSSYEFKGKEDNYSQKSDNEFKIMENRLNEISQKYSVNLRLNLAQISNKS